MENETPQVTPEASTRSRVMELVGTRGPISAADVAEYLGLTVPAVRRHLEALEADDIVAARPAPRTGSRGRPSREYVISQTGHDQLGTRYDDFALDALDTLIEAGHTELARTIIERYVSRQEERLRPVVESAGPDLEARTKALAAALAHDGYNATARTIPGQPGAIAMQLCQGHCPLHKVAVAYPEVCAAESESFTRLLGAPVRRLATLSHGSHVCTTHVGMPVVPATHALGEDNSG